METNTPEKRNLLLDKHDQSNSTDYKDGDDTDSICSMGGENRSPKRATLYGRTSLTPGALRANRNYAEIESARPPQTSRQNLYRRKQEQQEPPPQSEKGCWQEDGQKQASDKQWQMTSWLHKIRPSYNRRKEHATSGNDTTRLMSTSPPPTADYRSLSDCSENEQRNPQASSPRYQRNNAMYWSAKIHDELTTQLLTSKSAVAPDHENR